MSFNFKKFENTNLRLEKRITLTGSGNIGFPTKFYIDNNVKDYKFVVLYYDELEKAIGVLFSNDNNEKNKFTIIHSKKGYGGSIVIRSFIRSHNIDTNIYRGRYEWENYTMEGVGKLYVIRLKERMQKVQE